MNPPTRRTAPPRSDGLTLMAFAAGLAFGHIVQAMAEREAVGGQTIVVALFFLATASTSTVFSLLAAASRPSGRPPRHRISGWVVAIGAGFVASLGPSLL